MNLKIVNLGTFEKDVKRLYKKYKNLPSDLRVLQAHLSANPRAAIELGNNCYKIRLANSSVPTGKSGGFRVIYYYIDNRNDIYLMTMYSKTEMASVSHERLVEILKHNGLL